MSFNTELIDLLKTHHTFVDDDGELLIEAVKNHAWKVDHDLVKLLLSKVNIKGKFFDEIEGHWVFNINTFVDYISQKNFLDNSYTRFKNRIGLAIDGKSLQERGEVSLVWPYKDTVLEGGQTSEEERRNEIFFNEILAHDEINQLLAPKVLTGFVRYTPKGKEKVTKFKRSEGGLITDNLIIKGNNLLALHTLVQHYKGKVKLIYIDPPYNTGSDSFGYNDNFSHSSWLTFMKNRLEVSKSLMRTDGLIFIHIGDQEMHYLKVLADDVFGRDNFIATVPRKTRSGKSDVPYRLSQDFDWMLIYTKGASKSDALFQRTVERKYYKTPDFPNDEWRLADLTKQTSAKERPNSNFTLVNPKNGQKFPVNPNRSWAISVDTVDAYISKKKIVFPGDYDFLDIERPAMRVFKSEEIAKKGDDFDKAYVSSDFLNQAMDELLKNVVNKKGTDEIVNLFGRKAFSYPKNELLLWRIIEYATVPGDIILDFHLGSGTTAAVAHKTGRQYIGIEQMDYITKIPVERLRKVLKGEKGGISEEVGWTGGGDFVFLELMQYNEAFMGRIQAAKSSKELLKIWRDIAKNSFLNWYINPEFPEDAEAEFEAVGKEPKGFENQKRLLADLLDKNQLYVNYSEIDDKQFGVSKEDKALNKTFYGEA